MLVPLGANLAYSESLPVLSFFAYPFLSHLLLYGALVIVASVLIAALGMILLVRSLTADDGAAAVAGLLYGFGPVVLSFLWVNHFTMASGAALLPFGILFLLLFMRSGRPLPLVGLGLVVWVTAFTQVYMAAVLVVMIAVMSLVLVPARARRKHFVSAFVVGAANLFVAWAVVRFVFGDVSGMSGSGYGFTSRSVVNIVDLFVPNRQNPLLGFLSPLLAYDGANGDVYSYFLGWGILALAIGAVVARRRDVEIVALAVAGLVIMVFAFGSAIRCGYTELLTLDWTPYEWLARLPYFKMLDSPRRLIIGTALAVAALAGVGIATLAARSGRRRLVLVGSVLLWAVEYGQVGMPVTAFPVPPVYQHLASLPDSRTVFEFGGGVACSFGGLGLDWSTPSSHLMFWQTIHRKPRVGGYVSRVTDEMFDWFRYRAILSELFAMAHASGETWSGTCYTPAEVSEFIRVLNLGYVIVPKHARQTEFEQVTESILAGRIAKIETFDGYTLYTLVEDAADIVPDGRSLE